MTNTAHNYNIPPKTLKIKTNFHERITERSIKTNNFLANVPMNIHTPTPTHTHTDTVLRTPRDENQTRTSGKGMFLGWI